MIKCLLVILVLAPVGTLSLSLVDLRVALSHSWNAERSSFFFDESEKDGLANVQISLRDGITTIGAYCCGPNDGPTVLLLHEFFGLSPSICEKADGLAEELGVRVICPDTFRGEYSTFIPYCIWLALTTPTDRVLNDLEDTLTWAGVSQEDPRVAIMGFCYGGGKAIRFTTERRPSAATVICYGKPVTDIKTLSVLQQPVCGVFGSEDLQFPQPLLDHFQDALVQADVESDIRVYSGVGHAFWKDMKQIRQQEQPQYDAWLQITKFLRQQLFVMKTE